MLLSINSLNKDFKNTFYSQHILIIVGYMLRQVLINLFIRNYLKYSQLQNKKKKKWKVQQLSCKTILRSWIIYTKL